MHRAYRWRSLEDEGREYLDLFEDDGSVANGTITGPVPMTYSVRCDAQWRVRELEVERPGVARVHLRADGEDRWFDEENQPLPALDGCIDVDIAGCAYTNVLPIRRLGGRLAQRTLIQVAYVYVPSLAVHPMQQAYTLTAPHRFLYEGPIGAFSAELRVDADGFTIHYPALFQRET